MPAKSKDYHRDYYAKHREKSIAKVRRYQIRNPVTAAQQSAQRLARLERAAGRPRPTHCEVCGEAGKIVWDHCHATGRFRGWICDLCNKALGFVRDNPIRLRALADYISSNSNSRIN